jgi:hypothetical protein
MIYACPQDIRRRPTATNAAKRCTSRSDRLGRPSPQVRDPYGQNPTYRPARPPRPSPPAPAGGRIGVDLVKRSRCCSRFLNAPRRPTAQRRLRRRSCPGVPSRGASSVVISSPAGSRLGVPGGVTAVPTSSPKRCRIRAEPGMRALVRAGVVHTGAPTWRSPSTRQPGEPSAEPVRVSSALPPGCRVVALREGRGNATPCPPRHLAAGSGQAITAIELIPHQSS